MLALEGFGFEPPAGFRTEEVTVGLRFGLPGAGPGPSFMLQSKAARTGAKFEELVQETMVELAQTVGKLKNLTNNEITFTDGGKGAVLAYDFPTHAGELRQYFVMRLEKGRLCNITLTIPTASLTETNATNFMKAITSLKATS
ncbi:MAG: DcrB-related protein [Archangium sp.]|nr:DcrB-related protein [Archangium sp.]